MKDRRDHIISAVTGDAQPARLIGLAVEAETVPSPAANGWMRERLVSWSAAGWARTREGAYREWACSEASRERWARALLWAAKRGGVTWVIADRAVRVASLLGVWEMIDRGEIQWDGSAPAGARAGAAHGSDVRRMRRAPVAVDGGRQRPGGHGVPTVSARLAAGGSADGHAPSPARATGSVIIDDPPTILRLRVPGRPGRLWIMDVRNWGVDVPPDVRTAGALARWIADVMRRMVDALAGRGWGGLKATAGSQALATWRRRYMTHQVVAHADTDILALEEAAYIGGRCECGVIGPVDGPLYWIDRRSAYGHACATLSVPVKIKGRRDGQWYEVCADPILARRCLAEAYLCGGDASSPQATRDGIRYPVGRRATTLGGPELADAVRAGIVERIGRCVEYDCEPALAAYGRAVWDARCAYDGDVRPQQGGISRLPGGDGGGHESGADQALAAWTKRLLVALPGKLGQRCADWSALPDRVPPAPWCAWWGVGEDDVVSRLRSLGGVVQQQSRRGWTWDAVPAIAVWILSAARAELLRAIRAAGWDQCLYWDTDSLLLTESGWDRLRQTPDLIGCEIGQWRLVRTVSRAILYGVKHYEHDGVVTCAGMPRADTEPTRLRDRYWYRETFGMALGERHAPVAARRLRRYSRPPRYTLGRIGDGGRVYPHVAEDW